MTDSNHLRPIQAHEGIHRSPYRLPARPLHGGGANKCGARDQMSLSCRCGALWSGNARRTFDVRWAIVAAMIGTAEIAHGSARRCHRTPSAPSVGEGDECDCNRPRRGHVFARSLWAASPRLTKSPPTFHAFQSKTSGQWATIAKHGYLWLIS